MFEILLSQQINHVLKYEGEDLQERARSVLPVENLKKKAKEKLAILEKDPPCDVNYWDCLVLELLAWFKTFFSWFDPGECPVCDATMESRGKTEPTVEEEIYGRITVELYKCGKCGYELRFPRYWHPQPLLRTRKGRCMEWASCFTLFCRAMNIEARYVWDLTDHVWTEVFSYSQNRWVHTDCCEGKLDTPLMYEVGWNKKLSYIFAFSKDEVVDVTWRYSINHQEVAKRRTRVSENWLAEFLYMRSENLQSDLPRERRKLLEKRRVKELVGFFKNDQKLKEGENEGRQSGSLSWRLSRGETRHSNTLNLYVFKPTSNEIAQKELTVKYRSSTDDYSRPTDLATPIKGFQTLTYYCGNIFRKHEPDWKTTYLSRNEKSLPEQSGGIQWKFDWRGTGLTLKSVFVLFEHSVFEDAFVEWNIMSERKSKGKGRVISGNPKTQLKLLAKEFDEDTSSISINTALSGGSSWQHAQLFRQRDDAEDYLFQVTICFN